MGSKNFKYNYTQCGLSIFFMFTLLWLTVSAPFIIELKKNLLKHTVSMSSATSDSEDSNPFSGLNEEKSGNSSNGLSEYLHEPFQLPALSESQLVHTSGWLNLIYIAYYGELLSPPPEV